MSNSSKKRRVDDAAQPEEVTPPLFAMTPRENEFSERTWWMVDIESRASNQGASPLVRRCMRNCHWSLNQTKEILQAYRQFLTLKKELKDWDATMLSPSLLVDQMWHQHILDIANYYHDMILLCGGQIVLHNPDGGLDKDAKKLRDERTRNELIKKFGEDKVDRNIWGFPPNRNTINIVMKHLESGETKTFRVEQCSRLEETMREFATFVGTNFVGHKFVYNERRILRSDTPDMHGMKNGDAMHMIPIPDEKITIRVKDLAGEEFHFRIRTNTTMDRLFQTYAQKKGMQVCSLRFLFCGEKVEDFETPGSLMIEDGDQIDCVLRMCGC